MAMSSYERHVLLVDDDDALRDSVAGQLRRAGWTTHGCKRGREAVEVLERQPIDVLVTDLHMAEMTGSALLRVAQKRYPHVVRVATTTDPRREHTLPSATSAHQLLGKPYGALDLLPVLERAMELRVLLHSDVLRRLVTRNNELPTAPSTHLELAAAIRKADADVAEVAELVERDPALVARLLQLTSSAFFGRRHPPPTLRDAVMTVGLQTLEALVLEMGVVQVFESDALALDLADFQRRSLATACIARGLTPDPEEAQRAFVAGLLHGVGNLVVASRSPKLFARCRREADERRCSLAMVQLELMGATDAEVGAYLLGIWGLPQNLVEAIADQHRPHAIPVDDDVRRAVYIASRLARDSNAVVRAPVNPVSDAIDMSLVLEAGLMSKLETFREQAKEWTGGAAPRPKAPKKTRRSKIRTKPCLPRAGAA